MHLFKNATLSLAIAAGLIAANRTSAGVLTSESFTITSTGGQTGSSTTSDMIISGSPPTSFSGGAVGVQGSNSTKLGGGASPAAANVSFKFNIGSTIDTLNATYGAGNWAISNPTLSLQYTLYANNTIFGSGAGTFDIYWVGNDNWLQGTNDPAYATNAADLLAWSGSQADLATVNYAWTSTPASPTSAAWKTDKTLSPVTFHLANDPLLGADVTTATAGANPNVSLYLMATSSTVGMTIFTGGGTSLPTLSFDVVSAPEPTCMLLIAAAPLLLSRRRPG